MLRLDDILDRVQSYNPQADLEIIQKAYVFSAKVHAGQTRNSGEPYLVHPMEVAGILTQMHLDEASIVTGLLHDTVEDTLATQADLEAHFGAEIAALVDGVTKLSAIKFSTREEKQAENFRKMLIAMAKDIRVILVKLADRLHNMRTMQFMPQDKQESISQETMDIYAPLANRLGISWLKIELEDLAFSYLKPEDYAAVKDDLAAAEKSQRSYMEGTAKVIEQLMREHGVNCEVSGRVKNPFSIWKKMRGQNIPFGEVYDIIAFRLLLDSVGQCYEALGVAHSLWKPVPGRFKDYIAMPKPNQYQSLHTTVIGPERTRIEIQIRTREMHRIAEEGIAAHWQYKEGKAPKDARQFAWLRQLMEWQRDMKDPAEFLDSVKFDLFTDEVFVFTPKGDVMSLRRGATPVDFAFAVHSEVGSHCVGAKVNGRIVPLRYTLRNGDMIEVLTNPNARPSKDWLSFVMTTRAKTKIRHLIRDEQRERSKEIGKDLLERELRKQGRSYSKMLKSGELEEAAKHFRHKTPEELIVAIGYGKYTAQQVVKRIIPDATDGEEPKKDEPGLLAHLIEKVTGHTSGVVVHGMDDLLVRFGKCCDPLPGDPVTGFVTRGRGITVHSTNCQRALDLDPARRIDVTWDTKAKFTRPVTVRVVSNDKPGILANVSQTFTDAGVNITQANCKVIGDDRAINTFEVSVANADQLRRLVHQIYRVKGVISVERA